MSLIRGKPELKFVLKKGGLPDQTILLTHFTEFEENYEPVFISHELQTGEVRRKLSGFRYKATIYYEKVEGVYLAETQSILHRSAYTNILFYPYLTDNPNFFLDVTIDEDTIKWAYQYLLVQKDFSIKLISRYLLDFVPIFSEQFTHWGHIFLKLQDITKIYNQLP